MYVTCKDFGILRVRKDVLKPIPSSYWGCTVETFELHFLNTLSFQMWYNVSYYYNNKSSAHLPNVGCAPGTIVGTLFI
jgi:hypothetical protein